MNTPNNVNSATIDKRLLARRLNRAAATYDEADVLQRTVAEHLIERLDVVRLDPTRILDVGCATGYASRLLSRRYSRAQIVGVDFAWRMTRRARKKAGWFARSRYINADAEKLPFADASFDLVFSNLMLHWCDPNVAVSEFLRLLRPEGLLVFTTLGPDTLRELRQAWAEVDSLPRVHPFLDMHDVGDILVRTGFADPVMDVERYTLTYESVPAMLRDLKAVGAQNAQTSRGRGLTGRSAFEAFKSAYMTFADAGRLPATYEVIYGHAWAPASRRMEPSGVVRIPVTHIGRRR